MSARKIISVVPSLTELLFDLGLNDEVVGITKFCVHPKEWFRTKTRIGGTKNLNIEKIKSLQPDLILANKEENVREQIEELKKYFPVFVSDIKTVKDAFSGMKKIGDMVGRKTKSVNLVEEIERNFSVLNNEIKRNAAYFIWNKPMMSVGGDTFISSMMELAGFENIFKKINFKIFERVLNLYSFIILFSLSLSEVRNVKRRLFFIILLPSSITIFSCSFTIILS